MTWYLHSDEQNLHCPGCGKKFNRLGGLVGHLELKSCRALKVDIEAARKEISQHNATVHSARDYKDFSRSGNSSFAPEPLPVALAKSPGAFVQGQAGQPASGAHQEQSFRGDDLIGNLDIANWGVEAKLKEVNLIDVDDFPALSSKAPNITNAPTFGTPAVNATAANAWATQPTLLSTGRIPISLVHTPAVNTASRQNFNPSASGVVPQTGTPVVNTQTGNAWATQENSLAAASSATAGPIQLTRTPVAPAEAAPSVLAVILQNQAVARPDAEANPYDPDTPGFNASKYWIPMLDKYKCPYLGCGKGIGNLPAFLQHLKSPAHRNENLQCTKCLRYYATATALTQHMESQGVRCKVRNDGNYAGVVDEVTGGVALAKGRLLDKTVKYVVNEGILNPTGGVVTANKAAVQGKNSTFNNYWDNPNHEKKW
ncbi:uncharacterized protein PAC_17553 [Phialocephala subalpina]|uniref:C2H2-type domain-containing protein n=1 Tax=Phialocephala subalpina TaxID=576137 RepID=A0A1L7XRI4_9HELO|nr:uncharacterized protein PAC_17553 [Phialocephala subalpina]